MNGFALGLRLKKGLKATWKWAFGIKFLPCSQGVLVIQNCSGMAPIRFVDNAQNRFVVGSFG